MIELQNTPKLNSQFYLQKTEKVAKDLLGKFLVRNINGNLLAGKIVETEAYLFKNDEASHTHNGITARNSTMFKVGGYLYVYQIYGIHFCCNVVTGKENEGEAILIRALEPIKNSEVMAKNRFENNNPSHKNLTSLSNGPAKLCSALSITKSDDATNLLSNEIYILDAPNIESKSIITSTRIGLSKSKELLLRFYIMGNQFVSRK
jgi:DNA-3-methyladenine glycosylase